MNSALAVAKRCRRRHYERLLTSLERIHQQTPAAVKTHQVEDSDHGTGNISHNRTISWLDSALQTEKLREELVASGFSEIDYLSA